MLQLVKFSIKLFNLLNFILPNYLIVLFVSKTRSIFIRYLINNQDIKSNITNYLLDFKPRFLWGIKFNNPLMNAAGLFKNGEGYTLICNQGFGGYMGGTSTYNIRCGNKSKGIKLPFIILPNSDIAINALGLPNNGELNLDKLMITNNKKDGCPIGWSLMRSPDYNVIDGLNKLIESLFKIENNLLIDFVEINESCPNVTHQHISEEFDLNYRLKFIADNFLNLRNRKLPVIIKVTNDISEANLYNLIDILVKYNYDGINIGNTSINYNRFSNKISNQDVKLFNYFIKNFKGGISGDVLKDNSLQLSILAIEYVHKLKLPYEFNVIRTGGINSINDIKQSEKLGIKLNQWYTGYIKSLVQ